MWKTHKTTIIVTVLLCLLPVVAGVILWDRLPDPMPIHFGVNNEPNGWGSKPLAVFGIPVFMAAIELFCVAMTGIDPKRRNIPPKNMAVVLWTMPAMCAVVSAVMYAAALGRQVDVGFWALLAVGVLFLVMGNLLPKVSRNYTYGFKLPWTLESDENWQATHRVAGFTMSAGGLVLILTGFLQIWWLVVAVIVLMVLVPAVYSYGYYRRHG